MNIIYVVEDFSENGGVERIVSQKAAELSDRYGHTVTIISVYKDPRPILNRLPESVKMMHLDVPFAAKGKGKTATLLSRIKTLAVATHRLNKAISHLSPQIIFFTTTLGALLLPFCRTKARRVYESHSARKFTPYHSLFWLTERKADAVVCLTPGDAKDFGRARHVYVIPNFIECPQHSVADYSAKKAIAVGRLEAPKGFDILVNCWPEIARRHPHWHLDIYGEGSLRGSLQEQIERLGMQSHITLRGRSTSIMDVYPQYSLHIMPSRYEGMPMTLIEAQACGLPSVVTDFQYGASDIIADGRNGIIVHQDDSKALTEAVCSMMSSEELRRQCGNAAKDEVKAYFKENVFTLWTELIGTLAK